MIDNEFSVKWINKKALKDAFVIKGIPGVGSISYIAVDYLINKLKAELVCKIYSSYLPKIVIVNPNSTVEQPCFELYLYSKNKKKIVFLKNNYPPTNEFYIHKTNEFFSEFFKKQKIKQVITIAGIAYKTMPKSIKLHAVATNKSLKKKLEKTNLIFDGNKSVSLIIGSAGLLLTYCEQKNIPGFCILVSTWGHPKYVGIKESRKVIEFLSNYLKFKVDLTDLDKEIKRLNIELKKVDLPNPDIKKQTDYNKSRYIG